MSAAARRPAAVFLGLVVASGALVGSARTGRADAAARDVAARDAAALLARTRDAPSSQRFTGAVLIRWRSGTTVREVTVDVRDDAGTVEAVAGTHAVVDQGTTTFLRSGSTWMGFDVAPPEHVPAPDAHWALREGQGPVIAGRVTTSVEVRRADGRVAETLLVDPVTGLLLGRDVHAPDGAVERSFRYVSLTLGAPVPPVAVPPSSSTARDTELASVPQPYLAAARVGSWVLASRVRHGDGVLLTYADGVFLVSVLEQRGELQWSALPSGGETTSVDGARARRYTAAAGGELVWERDSLVVTCVTDAPSDVLAAFASRLEAGEGRSGWRTAVDFVLGPFGWR